MKTNILCGKICLIVVLTLFSINLFSQNIGINTTGATPAATNLLEVLQPSAAANNTVGIYVSHAGNTAGNTYYGLQSIVNGGAGTNYYAGYFSASGATNNYGLVVI